ncbi:MAG: hypothetical protein ACLR2E_04100 [Lachnospiraceae bacterium]
MEATDELYQPLRQPVFLQRADEAEDADPEEIFRERWGTPEDPTADGLEFHREFQEAEEIPPFGEEETEVPESCEDASMEEVPHEENRRFMRSRKTTWMLMKSQKPRRPRAFP